MIRPTWNPGRSMSRKAAEYRSTFTVTLLATETTPALHEMLRYLKWLSHQVSTVRLSLPVDVDLWPYFSDRPKQYTVCDEFMIRIASMEALDGLSINAPNLSIAIDVSDPQAAWNQGVWALCVDAGTLRVSRGGLPDLRCGIEALSSVLSGFSTFDEMIAARLIEPLETYLGQDLPKTVPFLADHF